MDKPFLVIVSRDDATFARVYEVPRSEKIAMVLTAAAKFSGSIGNYHCDAGRRVERALFGEDFDEDRLAPFRKRELEECSWCLEASDYSRVFLFTVFMP